MTVGGDLGETLVLAYLRRRRSMQMGLKQSVTAEKVTGTSFV